MKSNKDNTNNNIYISDSFAGQGVFAAKKFYPGDLILTFSGKRVNSDDPVHMTELGANLLQTGYKTYIMPESPAVFINHSCSPNAGIMKNRKLIAIKKINENEEITFDYSTTMDEDLWTMQCLCNEPTCRHIISDFDTLPQSLKNQYISLNIVQKFIAHKYKKHYRQMKFL
ncbi:MAG TPA: SET domain-containing protein-lysine N-methyltransferase [Thermodesulfobacteriota bacterium]|nr:SET domain-containing protein-lysine N-methyltransferase [Thermodesulfobacteriota bacterium]